MIVIPVTIAVLVAALVYVGIPMAWRWWQQRELTRRCAVTGTLVLTFDDGPGPVLTTKLLDLLHSRQVRATFFLTGRRAMAHPSLVDRIMLGGHELGCHTDRHRHPWRSWPWTTLGDIRRGYASLRPWMKPDAIFRPPHGKLTLPGLLSIISRGAPLGWWTVDAGDTKRRLPCLHRLVDSVRKHRGGVVLMHDFHCDPRRAVHVLSLASALIDLAREERWTICTLGELQEQRLDPTASRPLRFIPGRGRRRAA